MTEERSQDNQRAVDELRRVLANGFAFVRGQEVTEAVSARSFEEMLVLAIKDIEEDESDTRPSRLNAIRRLKEDVIAMVAQAKQMPSSVFELRDSETESTREDGTGPGESSG